MQAPVITQALLVALRRAVKLRSRKHSSHYRNTDTSCRLTGLGCTKLGKGHFGEAWLVEPGLVLKISGPAGWGKHESSRHNMQWYEGLRDAWPLFVEHCKGNPSKHLPRVYYTERLTSYITFAIMEELKEGGDDATRYQWERYIETMPTDCPAWLLPIGEMAAAGRSLDLHSDNVMVRADGTMVLTDPFSYAEVENEYT